MANIIMWVVFALIGLVLFINIIKVFTNIFRGPDVPVEEDDYDEEELDPVREEIRNEINEKIKPHLNSLEGMYEKSEVEDKSFSAYVFEKVKGKLSPLIEKDEKLVEEEVCKCCADYEGAECKENFCLDGSGISCDKV
jgi:hypothetical protein